MFGQEPPNFVEQFRHQNYTRTANKTVTSMQAIPMSMTKNWFLFVAGTEQESRTSLYQ